MGEVFVGLGTEKIFRFSRFSVYYTVRFRQVLLYSMFIDIESVGEGGGLPDRGVNGSGVYSLFG